MEKSPQPLSHERLAAFVGRIAAVASEPDAAELLTGFDPDVQVRFAAAAVHLPDEALAVVMTVARRAAMRSFFLRPGSALRADDPAMREWATQRLARTIEAAAVLAPVILQLLSGAALLLVEKAGRLQRMAETVATRFDDESMDETLVRGYAVHACLVGGRSTPWELHGEPDYRWAAEHYGLLAANWERFAPAHAIDERTVAEIESLGRTPMSVGAL